MRCVALVDTQRAPCGRLSDASVAGAAWLGSGCRMSHFMLLVHTLSLMFPVVHMRGSSTGSSLQGMIEWLGVGCLVHPASMALGCCVTVWGSSCVAHKDQGCDQVGVCEAPDDAVLLR